MKSIVHQKLETHKAFRERKDRGVYLSVLALRELKLNNEVPLTVEDLTRFAITYATLERQWRDVLSKYPELRGSDYEQKEILEQNKMIDLGYTS